MLNKLFVILAFCSLITLAIYLFLKMNFMSTILYNPWRKDWLWKFSFALWETGRSWWLEPLSILLWCSINAELGDYYQIKKHGKIWNWFKPSLDDGIFLHQPRSERPRTTRVAGCRLSIHWPTFYHRQFIRSWTSGTMERWNSWRTDVRKRLSTSQCSPSWKMLDKNVSNSILITCKTFNSKGVLM